jgi:hypothetical protein
MTATRIRMMLVTMLFLGGCGGCEHPENAPGVGGANAPTAAGGAIRAPGITPDKIQAGSVVPTVVGRQMPTARPAAEAGEAQPPAAAPDVIPPEAPANNEDDCIVVADANPDYGPPPLAVAFSAEAECSGGQTKYDWDFGDGSPHSNETNPSHTYTKAGEYTATVTVSGRGEATANDEIDVTVEEAEGGDAAE